MNVEKIIRKPRRFVPEDFTIKSWDEVEIYFKELKERKIESTNELQDWFRDWSELESVLSEDLAWRYIKMTCDTADKQAVEAYQFFITEISPKVAPYDDDLNRKALASEYVSNLNDTGYKVMIRGLKRAVV